MRILADENLAGVRELFATYGEVHTVPGRSINARMLRDFDALLVRSVTQVSAQMFDESRCRFVGTATSGLDHVDAKGLVARGIKLSWAKGCNGNSVVDYFFSVLAALAPIAGDAWQHASVGIIGCGHIGSTLAEKLLQLGMSVRIYDPLLTETHGLAQHFTSLQQVLQQQIITLHVPLTRDGVAPTLHMLAEQELTVIPGDSLLINAARGAAIDNKSLGQWLKKRPQQRVVLDTWEKEPAVSLDLLQQVSLGTPHIAGYSQQGKDTGTHMILQDFCRHFGLQVTTPRPEATEPLVPATQSASIPVEQLDQLILAAYDVRSDHRAMQLLLHSQTPAEDFDALRKHYPVRHEFSHYHVNAAQLHPTTQQAARILGFRCAV